MYSIHATNNNYHSYRATNQHALFQKNYEPTPLPTNKYLSIINAAFSNKKYSMVDDKLYETNSFEYFCQNYDQDQSIKLKDRDLAYGTGSVRQRFLKFVPGFSDFDTELLKTDSETITSTQTDHTIDLLNDQFVCPQYETLRGGGDVRKVFQPELFASKFEEYARSKNICLENLNEQERKELENEFACTYDPEFEPIGEDAKDFKKWLDKHEKYSPMNSAGPDQESVDQRVGRACKGGLEYTLTNGNKIYFVLDDFNLDIVLKDLEKSPSWRNFTGKEFKWVYRNRDKDIVKNNVQFVENGQRVPAPWDDPNKAELFNKFQNAYENYRSEKAIPK